MNSYRIDTSQGVVWMHKHDILYLSSIAYYSGWCGIEVKGIEYGIDDYLFLVSNAWCGEEHSRCHRLKIKSNFKGSYVVLNGYKLYIMDFIRM